MVEGAELSVVLSLKQRGVRAGLTLFAMLAATASAITGAPLARSAPHTPRAHATRSLKASDTAHLHYVSASGSVLYEQGAATGTLPGSMHVHLNVGATFTGSFTIYTRGGTIRGHGSAKPHGSGPYESFGGSLLATGGTGHYTHAHGRAGLYGTFNRNTYALLVQTTGTLLY
jgi:hypothetical protein